MRILQILFNFYIRSTIDKLTTIQLFTSMTLCCSICYHLEIKQYCQVTTNRLKTYETEGFPIALLVHWLVNVCSIYAGNIPL